MLSERIQAALERTTNALLAERTAEGHWEGELSSSALSTATAVIALAMVPRESKVQSPKSKVQGPKFRIKNAKTQGEVAFGAQIPDLEFEISAGLNWLAHHSNADGGWGDTINSLSNISTTALCWAAFGAVPGADEQYESVVNPAEKWLASRLADHASRPPSAVPLRRTGITDHASLVNAIIARYGNDRTFSAPILTACALAGRLGPARAAWRWVLPLPFELAAFPRQWFAALRLPVVSYALPALIAIGQARHFHLPSRNPLARLGRILTRQRTLRILSEIQPACGGFLEATPLTSFVVMSLAGSGQVNHKVTRKGMEFLLKAQRPDGSWPIDTNLATWLTTLALDAISKSRSHIAKQASSGQVEIGNQSQIRRWLLDQQYRQTHPYTQAAPGGWAWTNLPGGVPDADDTAGAVLALSQLRSAESGVRDAELRTAAQAGIKWLLDLQNRDGGIPTFCRGWGSLPFDRSSADITAHAMRCWLAWLEEVPQQERNLMLKGIHRAVGFLARTQRPDGAWAPLWFGNQFAPGEENLTYGTARVVCALAEIAARQETKTLKAARIHELAVSWLVKAQNTDGGWGGAEGVVSSTEETALAVESLAASNHSNLPETASALSRGVGWLLEKVEKNEWTRPTPIGFYFASLWYYEKLYPQIFTVAALGRAARELVS